MCATCSETFPGDVRLPRAVLTRLPIVVRLALQTLTGAVLASEPAVRHWSFEPPSAPATPVVRDAAWPRTDVDRFVLARLDAAGLKPSPEAPAVVLLRRACFDLTGLPPTAAQVEEVERKATASGGSLTEADWSALVDSLLASPAFGERWGRHWLDVARYAESTGKERNHTLPEAWRYRDWVVAAFNADKPYDRFLREQVAGDLLAEEAPSAEKPALQVATGFLALGPKGLNERRREQFVADVVDEQIDTVTRSVLGVTVACARCHDHKFDPISQRDYYALAGIFRSTETCYGTTGDTQRNRQPSALIPIPGAPLAERVPLRLPPAPVRSRLAALRSGQPPAQVRREAAMATLLEEDHRHTNALAMGVREGRAEDAFLLARGEITQRQGKVPRGFIPALHDGSPVRIPREESGRRQLADWLTARSNPLTARVAVNRVWQHLFGRGLVPTGDDFGRNGQPPTHPELLDHLAVGFMEDGWSTKRLIRRLMSSSTYRSASSANAAAQEVDPDDTLLWRARPRRLEAEALRDALLAAAGTLESDPPRGSVVAQIGDMLVGGRLRPERWDSALLCRSLYLPVVRDAGGDFLDQFDGAESSLVVTTRDETNVPAQALFLMNSPFVMDQSRALALRLIRDDSLEADRDRVAVAHRKVLGRSPTDAEVERALGFLLRESAATVAGRRPAGRETAWSLYVQALFTSAEFRYLR